MLNSLQGVFIFVLFTTNRTKRKHLKRKFLLLFKMAYYFRGTAQKCCCQGSEVTCTLPVSSFTSQISRNLSSSSGVSSLSTHNTSLNFGVSSISLCFSDDEDVKKPQCGVITLSHSALHGNDVQC